MVAVAMAAVATAAAAMAAVATEGRLAVMEVAMETQAPSHRAARNPPPPARIANPLVLAADFGSTETTAES